jgi:hypothetical protein
MRGPHHTRPAGSGFAWLALMTVGTQHDDANDVLTVLAALGVNHICSRRRPATFDGRVATSRAT